MVPEIADYEVRRELIRADKRLGLERLDTLAEGFATSRYGRHISAAPPGSGRTHGTAACRRPTTRRWTAT